MKVKLLLTALIIIIFSAIAMGQSRNVVSGKVISADNNEILESATIYIKGSSHGTATNSHGIFHLHITEGKHTLVISMLGFETVEKSVDIKKDSREKILIKLKPYSLELEAVTISASSVQRVNGSAYNAVGIDAKQLHNSTQDLASAMIKVPGVKLRESGGVGSDMQFTLDGFSGKHIKLFIDGVPQDGVGGSFSINNIPVNFAERIEVYRGVVPVGFGSDAIGGVVNIVTASRKKLFVDAAYSFGSFNTHKGHLNFGQTLDNGIFYELNAFANYSDNNYKIDTYVEDFETGGIDKNKIETVNRFHDTYHNEAIIGKIGVKDKKYADRLMLSLTASQSDKEIQNGVRQEIVFGDKRRKNSSLMPALEYKKRNLFTKGLSVNLTANYNYNLTHNIDTATYQYNWHGDKLYNGGKLGEQNYQDVKYTADNLNGTFTADYMITESHSFVINNVFSSYTRKTSSTKGISDNSAVAASFDKTSAKNISGLSYRYRHAEKWNISVFGKHYLQNSSGPRNSSSTGNFSYVEHTESVDAFGYGAAGTIFIIKGLQAKLSFEKAYRLPTTEELFGDDDMELGAMTLRPETSNNANFSMSYLINRNKHSVYIDAGLIYRDTKDYIRRTITSMTGGLYYGLYENHGNVLTQGMSAELRYSFADFISIGGNITYLNAVDNERYVSSNSLQESTTYNVRIPNTPYLFANGDISVNLKNCLKKGNNLNVTYGNLYMHEFPLYWEVHGNKASKEHVPTQFSHDLSIGYSMNKGRYNITFECKNFTDEKLYDNYSLQKAGRAFYGKFRYYFEI